MQVNHIENVRQLMQILGYVFIVIIDRVNRDLEKRDSECFRVSRRRRIKS